MEWQSITAFIPDLSFQTASQVHTESDSTADHDHGQLELFVDYGSAGTTVPEPFGGMHPTDSLQLSSTSEQMQDIRHTLNQDHFSGWLGGFPPEMAIENPSIDLDPAIEQINVPLSQPSAWQSPASDMCPNCQTSTLGLPFRNLANTFYGSQNLHANISIGSTDSSQIMLSNIFPDSNVSGPKLLSLDAPGGIELGDPITNSMSALGLDGFENPAAALEFSSVLLVSLSFWLSDIRVPVESCLRVYLCHRILYGVGTPVFLPLTLSILAFTPFNILRLAMSMLSSMKTL